MQIIRRLDDPLVLLTFGYVEPGGLGSFDPAIYEEVTLATLPQGWSQESLPLSLAEALEQDLITGLTNNPGLLSDTEIGDLFVLKAGIIEMLKFNQYDAAKAKIADVVVPQELESVKNTMLQRISDHVAQGGS